MTRFAAFLVVLVTIAACGSAGPNGSPSATASSALQPLATPAATPTSTQPAGTGTPDPTQPPASPACGGFHLVVDNKSSKPVVVSINGEEVKKVKAGKQLEIIELGWSPPLPPLPWDVSVTKASDGTELVSKHYEPGEQGARIIVKDNNVDDGPGGCG